jgi:hypothetical protein
MFLHCHHWQGQLLAILGSICSESFYQELEKQCSIVTIAAVILQYVNTDNFSIGNKQSFHTRSHCVISIMVDGQQMNKDNQRSTIV